MANFANINNALNSTTAEEPKNIKVSLVSISGEVTNEVPAGMTIAQYRDKYGVSSATKIVDAEGNALGAHDVLTDDIELFVATPKKNG